MRIRDIALRQEVILVLRDYLGLQAYYLDSTGSGLSDKPLVEVTGQATPVRLTVGAGPWVTMEESGLRSLFRRWLP